MLGNDNRIDSSLAFSLVLFMLKNNHFEPLLVIYIPVWGLLIAIAHERVLSSPPDDCKPKKHWLGLAVIEQPQIQQRTSALPNPSSTMCLFSPAVETKNTGFWNNWRVSECVVIWRYITSTPKKRTQKNLQMKKCLCASMHTYSIYVLKHTKTQ